VDVDFATLYEQAVSSIEEVCSQLSDEDWDLPTDLPGWSVKDNLSHLVHFEATAIGQASPDDLDVSHRAHATDAFQIANEKGVEHRRGRSGKEVLDEFVGVTRERLRSIHSLTEEQWDDPIMLPVGEVPQGRIMPIRLSDFYFHEQDIRRATGRPGHLRGGIARLVFERFGFTGMPRVIGKEVAPPDGTVVAFDVGEPGESFAVRVSDGRGEVVPRPADPAVTIACDFETFLCLVGGRWTRERAGDRARVEGDPALAARIFDEIAMTP